MLPLLYPKRWRIAGVVLVLGVLALAISPAIWPWADNGRGWFPSDKWLHAITFTGLALWYTGQYARGSYVWLVLGLLAFGGLIEIIQSMLTYRSAEWGDMLADALGIAAGIAIAMAGLGGWSQRFERWLEKRFG